MSNLTRALIADLDEFDIEELAEKLRPLLMPSPSSNAGWMDSATAAKYLGISLNALRKFTAARAIPFEQDGPGCKCWFRRPDLDAWRRGDRNQHQ